MKLLYRAVLAAAFFALLGAHRQAQGAVRSSNGGDARFSSETERGHAHDHGFFWGDLVKPFGIATLALLVVTATLGLLRRRKPRLLLKWHKRLAITTVVVALAHAALVILLY